MIYLLMLFIKLYMLYWMGWYVLTRKCVHLRENTQITSLHAEKCSELADWKRLTDHSNLLNKCLDNLTRAKPYLLTPQSRG
jgi:hypothetical protein